MKLCTKCQQSKSNQSFGRRSDNSDGLQSWCKQCRSLHDNLTRFRTSKLSPSLILPEQNIKFPQGDQQLDYDALHQMLRTTLVLVNQLAYRLERVEDYLSKLK